MEPDIHLVLYGDSVFLAGIQAELEADQALALTAIKAGCPDALEQIWARRPQVVLCDLAEGKTDFALALLRAQPELLLIGVDPSSDHLLVLSGLSPPALSVGDLTQVIKGSLLERNDSDEAQNKNGGSSK